MKYIQGKCPLFLLAMVFLGAQRLPAQNPIATELRKQWDASRKQLVQIAEAMPESKFAYRATPEVRSFGEIILHVAGENMTWMETTAGLPKPGVNERFEHLKTRAEILRALSDHFDYGAKVLADMNDAKALESIPFGRRGPTPRWVIVMQAVGHNKEHYGNLVTYVRLNNMVPPSSADRPPTPGA